MCGIIKLRQGAGWSGALTPFFSHQRISQSGPYHLATCDFSGWGRASGIPAPPLWIPMEIISVANKENGSAYEILVIAYALKPPTNTHHWRSSHYAVYARAL